MIQKTAQGMLRAGGVALCCGVVVGALLTACSENPRTRTADSSREVSLAGADLRLHASASERFGGSAGMGMGASSERSAPGLVWDLPSGWTERAPTQMRVANFGVAGDERAECYLTVLVGEAGGLAANVNRWRVQMSLPALTGEMLAALPRAPLFGGDAVLVDFTGTWTGMSGAGSDANWRLVGLLRLSPEGSLFLKMTGPESVIAAQKDAFLALARSLRSGSEAKPASPHGAGSGAAGGMGPGAPGPVSQTGIAWTAPDGWRKAPDRTTRAVSFYVGPTDDVECYVTVLDGDAGGLLANVNRWCNQMHCAELDAAELDALEKVELLGGSGVLVEIEGGEPGAEPNLLLGALLVEAGRSVFVKLGGPRAAVAAQRDAFRAFCRSLHEDS